MRKSKPHYADQSPELLKTQCDLIWNMYKAEVDEAMKQVLLSIYTELGQRYLDRDKYASATK